MSQSSTFQISPIDSWFFRDGQPYNFGERNQAGVESLFPPHPTTLVGCLRASLARSNGWNGHGRWSKELQEWLGNGYEDLADLQFNGPFIQRVSKGTTQILVPAPLHLAGTETEVGTGRVSFNATSFLTPDAQPQSTDLGAVRLPEFSTPSPGLKPAEGRWVTLNQLTDVLHGRLPNNPNLIGHDELFSSEPRVGIRRDPETRTTGDGEIYSPTHVRLNPGVDLWARVGGLPDDVNIPDDLVLLGGESRLAHVKPNKAPEKWPASDSADRAALIFLTPAFVGRQQDGVVQWPQPGDVLPDVNEARLVSACAGKPVHIGGWDSLEHRPRPLHPALPAGTVFFVEGDSEVLKKLHGTCIGNFSNYGYGHVVVGQWPKTST